MLDKTFTPAAFEQSRQQAAASAGEFAPSGNGASYTIMMPPPNVTGTLHIGHALTFTLQDILIRSHRMRGENVLWQPGLDHAGIATQMVVERQLAADGVTRQKLGREAFVEAVWRWKEHSGGTIVSQMQRLGVSADWTRGRFTLDDGLSAAVRKIFVDLYRDGLIYKDKRLVNWDTALQTAVSDLEVLPKETKGHLYYIFYPLVDATENTEQRQIFEAGDVVDGHTRSGIIVATTRPETLFGDSAVAVHPDDVRYKHLIGKSLRLPLTDRVISLIADEYSDPEKGSGAVKITPAHDFNDFAVGRRHHLAFHNILNADGTLNDTVPPEFIGLSREAARKKALHLLEERGYLVKTEPLIHVVPHGDRSGTVIEPYLTEQWYVDAKKLAQPALEAVRDGTLRFVPEHWTKTYVQWLENIEPWCISRQLWWGHRIPAWYSDDGRVFVAENELEAQAKAGAGVVLRQDDDVLDTWFSSALWPFSTLGWPDKTPDLAQRYPTSVLVTGFDIIFFWVARMVMFGLYAQGQVPFREIYIHALVRDATGAKMSKSKGNVIDPIGLVDKYGADALRFTLCRLAVPGRDVKLSEAGVEAGRNFATKLWNAARYCEMNMCLPKAGFNPVAVTHPLNQWILHRLHAALCDVHAALDSYRFHDVADTLYHFVWDDFCDWYLEFTKPLLAGDNTEEVRATTGFVLQSIITTLHPVMPFITAELNERLVFVPISRWSEIPALPPVAEIDTLITMIRDIRSARSTLNVPAGAKLMAFIAPGADAFNAFCTRQGELLRRLGRLENITVATPPEKGVVAVATPFGTLYLDLKGQIDFAFEQARLSKEIDTLRRSLGQTQARLDDAGFVAKAPEEIIEEYKERLVQGRVREAQIQEALGRLVDVHSSQ